MIIVSQPKGDESDTVPMPLSVQIAPFVARLVEADPDHTDPVGAWTAVVSPLTEAAGVDTLKAARTAWAATYAARIRDHVIASLCDPEYSDEDFGQAVYRVTADMIDVTRGDGEVRSLMGIMVSMTLAQCAQEYMMTMSEPCTNPECSVHGNPGHVDTDITDSEVLTGLYL